MIGQGNQMISERVSSSRKNWIQAVLPKRMAQPDILMLACLILNGFIVCDHARAATSEKEMSLDILAERVRSFWLLHHHAREIDVSTIRERLDASGRFLDLDYEHPGDVDWPAKYHLYRMARVIYDWAHEQKIDERERLRRLVHRILDGYRYFPPKPAKNWWYNQIGQQMYAGEALVVFANELTDEQRVYAIELLQKSEQVKHPTGQNLVWVQMAAIYRGLLDKDTDRIQSAFARIWQEVNNSGPEGIQPDASFFQHGRQFYNGGYGRNFALDMTRLAHLAHDTPYAVSDKTVKRLSHLILDGHQILERGGTIAAFTCGRGITRIGDTNQREDFLMMIQHAAVIDKARQTEYESWKSRLQNDPTDPRYALRRNKLFFEADAMMHHRAAGSFSIRFCSKRNLGTESGNGEGIKNHYLGFGLIETRRRGDEYDGIYPVWNWRRIPGLTIEQATNELPQPSWGKGTRGNKAFVGGISDNRLGCMTQIFDREDIQYKQTVFCFDEGIIVLGAGLTFDRPNAVVTTLDQCHWQGDVWGGTSGSIKHLPIGENAWSARSGTRIWHNQILYILLDDAVGKLKAKTNERSGSWHEINRRYEDVSISRKVFELVINHGRKANTSHYAYAILPGVKADADMSMVLPDLEIAQNTPSAQALRIGHVWLIVFFAPGRCGPVRAEQPCIVLLEEEDEKAVLRVSNPMQAKRKVNLQLSGNWHSPEGSLNISADSTCLSVTCPPLGQSLQLILRRVKDDHR